MLIDTHAHVNFNAYKDDACGVIRRSLSPVRNKISNGVWMINIGTNYETSKKAVEIAQKYPEGVFAAIGLHPIHLETGLLKIKNDLEEIEVRTKEEEFDYEKYKELAKNPKVVAIGEIGLDYYWRPKTTKKKELFKQKQKDLLLRQLELAKELNLPVVFHCRMGHQDLIEFLSNNPGVRPEKAVAHGFVGNLEELQKYLDFGYYIGFNGIIFKKIEGINFKENIKRTPLDRILVETDCPYLTPPLLAEDLVRAGPLPIRNEPLYVKYIAEEIAKIKNLKRNDPTNKGVILTRSFQSLVFEEISRVTTENAKKLFKI